MGEDRDGHGGDHDGCGAEGHLAQRAWMNAMPIHRAHRDHDHHGHQRSHRDLSDEWAKGHHEDHDENAGRKSGDPGAGLTGFHVDHGLADHGATAHTAEEAGNDVGHPLTPTFAGLIRVSIGHIVNQLRGHQRFDQTHDGHGQRIRKDDLQCVQGEGHIRDHPRRQP